MFYCFKIKLHQKAFGTTVLLSVSMYQNLRKRYITLIYLLITDIETGG